MDPDQLFGSLTAVLNDSTTPAEWPLGYLTSLNRDEWALVRRELEADPQNAAVLEKIDSALFVLCMDDSEPSDPIQATTVFLHNHGFDRCVL